ncbi:hypothetical protein A3F65_01405 [Candidatus Saccharibacteria bacterium RIFCSPHIGHO2_12_FULL_47_16b]|nr:MAG: hypothetical protein A3F65_01405 [Candidatus Saccharibacteria bacterium RIFCSPHIGHO2_12_FULL_47_16b]OGL39182.1 MAG: hypothetical protein A3J32_02210 [Candidatus Saccharibacteria bacterium RIFCSPLOWO2_02_FULL_46_7]
MPLAHALKRRQPNCRLIYIGLRGENLEAIKQRLSVFDEIYSIRAGKFRRYHGQNFLERLVDVKTNLLNIRDFFKVMAGSTAAYRLLRKIKPDLVFSKGGYVVVPIGLVARLLKVPIITHDSDALPGLANRIVGRFAYLHTTGLPTDLYKDTYPDKTIKYVGIPVDERIKPVDAKLQADYKRQIGIVSNSFVLLVSGGGLGSKTLNEKMLSMAPQFLAHPESYLIHLTGAQHKDKVKGQYQKVLTADQLDRLKVMGFSGEFYKYSAAADLIIARAGASSLAEFALQQKACIIIPAAFLSGAHQLKNTDWLKKHDAALITNDEVESNKLLNLVEKLMKNPKRRAQLGNNLSSLAQPAAADNLAKLLLS